MSTTFAATASVTLPEFDDELLPSPDRRRGPIEIVTTRAQRRARPRIVYALIVVVALFLLLMAQLGMSIALSQGAYQISSLQSEQTVLGRTQQVYSEKLGVLASPQNLANNATALGMVRGQSPAFLDLASGTVYGTPTAASKGSPAAENLIANSLLTGIPVVTKDKKTSDSTASSSDPAGAAASQTGGAQVPSSPNQLAAPETR